MNCIIVSRVASSVTLSCILLCGAYSVWVQSACAAMTQVQSNSSLAQQVEEARAAVQLKPDDAHVYYVYGELLRKCGHYRQAACEFLDAVDLDPNMYVAFHQIAQMKCDPSQIDEAFTYLSELDEDHPNNLMIKIALSELLERKGEYYKAARELIDISYTNKVPSKVVPRLKARIHYLLAKVREVQSDEKSSTALTVSGEDESGVLPPPLPDDMPVRPLKLTDSQNSHAIEGTGHSTLLP